MFTQVGPRMIRSAEWANIEYEVYVETGQWWQVICMAASGAISSSLQKLLYRSMVLQCEYWWRCFKSLAFYPVWQYCCWKLLKQYQCSIDLYSIRGYWWYCSCFRMFYYVSCHYLLYAVFLLFTLCVLWSFQLLLLPDRLNQIKNMILIKTTKPVNTSCNRRYPLEFHTLLLHNEALN